MERTAILILLSAAACLAARSRTAVYTGEVVDASTNKPVAGATITTGEAVVMTGVDGVFHIEASGETIFARACGYRRA